MSNVSRKVVCDGTTKSAVGDDPIPDVGEYKSRPKTGRSPEMP
jgi:hypothetical protein